MTLQVLSPSRHRHLRWLRYGNYAFAADRHLIELAGAEIAKAALSLPLAFVRQNDGWSLCVVLGFFSGQNLYVGPDGRWIAAYVPASLRGHPFHLGWDDKGNATLCVDVESGLLTEDEAGELFFFENGALSESVSQVWSFLAQTAEGLLALRNACAVIAKAGVIEPWPIRVTSDGTEHLVEGLHRINEAALNNLDGGDFAELHKAGVLAVAYAQLLSMGNLPDLGKLAQARAQAEAAERARAEVKPMITLPEDSSIDWDWSKIGKT